MKVLLIDVNCKNSSTGKIVYDLYSYLNERGEEAAICYGRGEKIVEKNIFKFGLDWETYLHALSTRITGFTGCFSFFSTRRLLKYIKEFNPDIVHIHELHAYFVNIKPLISYLKNNHIKTLMTLHCEFAYTGKCGHSAQCTKWQDQCNHCPHLRDYVSTLFFDQTHYMFNIKKKLFEDFEELSIVTPSQWLADRAKLSFLKSHSIDVIHNGVDTSVFYPRDAHNLRKELGISDNEKIVLALAPHLMSETKGGEYVLQIAKKMERENIRFILVGADVHKTIKASNVIIKGPIKDKDEIAQYYSLADAFIICSQQENYPTTCLEAQACGTPVYGFDVGAVKETLINLDSHIVENKDADALCTLLLKMNKKTPKDAQTLADMAVKKIESKNTSEQYYLKYIKMTAQ